MRIAVTGRTGQVAQALLERGPAAGVEVIAVGRPKLDLANVDTVEPALRAAAPDVIISAAAYTAVDAAESEPQMAHAVNGRGASAVARAAATLGIPVVHLSTDYVFSGNIDRPYREDDETGPVGVYGRSKLAGEIAVAAATPNHVILRTAWIYSPFGANFVRTMLRLAETRDVVGVVADQRGSPTSAHDIADAIVRVSVNLMAQPDAGLLGIFHLAGRGEATWADLAEFVFTSSRAHGGPSARVERIATSTYSTAAKRPSNSRLDCGKLRAVHGVTMPDWRVSVAACVGRLVAGAKEEQDR